MTKAVLILIAFLQFVMIVWKAIGFRIGGWPWLYVLAPIEILGFAIIAFVIALVIGGSHS